LLVRASQRALQRARRSKSIVSTETGNPTGSRRLNLKDIKEAPSASGESVGMELRAMRLQRGETIGQVSAVLRIRKDMVEALEHGRHDLLPGHAYEIGFVRSYSDYLRLDTPDVVRRYKAELAAQDTVGHFSLQVAEEEQKFSFLSVAIILVCLAAAAGGAFYLATQAGWIGERRPLGPTTTLAPESDPAGTTPAPDSMASPAPAAMPVPAPPSPLPPADEPVIVAPARPGGIVPPAPGEQAQAISGREMGKSNANARIVFIARRSAMLTISANDVRQPYINRTLNVGDAYRVPLRDGLIMDMSDAGAFDVLLDGEFIGRAGVDGVVISDFALSTGAYGAPPEPPVAAPPASAPAGETVPPVSATPVVPEPQPATPPVEGVAPE
jgi:cytoskeleton protein RodZ